MTNKFLIGGALALCVIGGGAYLLSSHGGAATSAAPADAAKPDDAAGGVLVQTAKASYQQMPLTMSVFGEVAPVKVESLSFPQAGQLARVAVSTGQLVRQGELIAELSSDPAALVAYEQAASALAFAQREQQRLQDLLGLQLATQSQLDAARKQALDARAALAAQERLGGAHGAARIVAPYDAVVTALPVPQGERVAAGATVVQLARSAALRVLLSVEPARAGELQPGMKVSLLPPGADADTAGSAGAAAPIAAPIVAQIASVQRLVDPKTQLAGAIAPLPAAAAAVLAVGMHVQGTVALGERAAWALPRQAVLTDDAGAYVFQVAAGKARRVGVRKVVESGAIIGVSGKLDPALPVVILGNYELQDGARVRGGAQ
jgi:membrane fusion protein (multidrug efflux system)